MGRVATPQSQTLGGDFGAAAAAGGGCGAGGATARPVTRGVGLPPPSRSRGRGGATTTTLPATATFDGFGDGAAASTDGFPLPPASHRPLFEAPVGDPLSPSWGNPSGGFISYFSNSLPHNPRLVGAMNNPIPTSAADTSPEEVKILEENENDTIRTEKRILWNEDEDVRVMSAWLKHSTDSTCGADKGCCYFQ